MRIALIVIVVLAVVVAGVFLMRSCGGRGDRTDATLAGQPGTEVSPPAESLGGDREAGPGAEGRLVDVGGHRLHIRSFGTGSPAVVIDGGIGDIGLVWQGVVDSLSGETMVVLYSLAGYGQSDPGPMPRSADQEVRELNLLLASTPVDPPFILVGHSLGALNALLYASEHRSQVDGLVLLDPPPLGFLKGDAFPDLRVMAERVTEDYRQDAKRARDEGDEHQARYLDSMASEHEQMFQSGWKWMASVRSLDDMPLVVIASGVPNPQFGASAEEFQRYWRDSSEDLSHLSMQGRFVFVEDSTHNLPGDATEEVVDAIRWCIAASRELPEYEIWQGEK